MARPVTAPEQGLVLPSESGESCVEALRALSPKDARNPRKPNRLNRLLESLSPEGLFWTTGANLLRKHSANLQKSKAN